MQDAARHLDEIFDTIRECGCVLLLDFDGTLAPLAPHHGEARISPIARAALHKIARRVPAAIISGRALVDVRRRVGLRNVAYAGCHGIEIEVGGRYMMHFIQKDKAVFERAKNILRAVAERYRGVAIEDKGLSFAMHYRQLSFSRRKMFRDEMRSSIEPWERTGRLRVIDDRLSIDVMPNGRHKGRAAQELFKRLSEGYGRLIPICIGDGVTDEDMFRAFEKSGITIRVDRKRGSAARYYFSNRLQVDAFLVRLADEL